MMSVVLSLCGGGLLRTASGSEPLRIHHKVSHQKGIEALPFKPKWVTVTRKGNLFKYKKKEFSSPRLYGDLIFTGGNGGFFYAMKKKNGHKVWRFKAEGHINSTPGFADDRVVFGDDKGNFYALTLKEGRLLWKVNLGSEISSEPALLGHTLYVGTLEGHVFALNSEDGSILWDRDFPYQENSMSVLGSTPPIIEEGQQGLLIGFADGTLRRLSLKGGATLWEKNFKQEKARFTDLDAAPLIDGDRIYIACYEGPLMALSRQKGGVLWQVPLIGTGVAMALEGDHLYVAGSDGSLYSVNKKDGKVLWVIPLAKGALTRPVVFNEKVIVGQSEGPVHFVNAETGEVIINRFANRGVSSDPVLENNFIYYLSNGGRLYSLKLTGL